jgi:ubiquinone/menaquinone biosynthesis C-methylase UbiE
VDLTGQYYQRLVSAFIRGRLMEGPSAEAYGSLFTRPLDELSEDDAQTLIRLGLEQGLRLHKFKRTMELPRVRKVLGILKGLQPQSLLDIGSGRGTFLWPLVNEFPALPVTAIDTREQRVEDIQAVHHGGVPNLSARRLDATALAYAGRSFDIVTMLEVLEHIPETQRALAEACRVAGRFLILSVPSKEDDNPEHIHLFDRQTLQEQLGQIGIRRVTFDHVLNHLIAIVRTDPS